MVSNGGRLLLCSSFLPPALGSKQLTPRVWGQSPQPAAPLTRGGGFAASLRLKREAFPASQGAGAYARPLGGPTWSFPTFVSSVYRSRTSRLVRLSIRTADYLNDVQG